MPRSIEPRTSHQLWYEGDRQRPSNENKYEQSEQKGNQIVNELFLVFRGIETNNTLVCYGEKIALRISTYGD